MNTRHCAKMVHEGNYVAEVEVDLLLSDEGWSPYRPLMMPTSWMMFEMR